MDRDHTSPVIEYASRRDRKRRNRNPWSLKLLRRSAQPVAAPLEAPEPLGAGVTRAPRPGADHLPGQFSSQDMLIITRFIEYLAAERGTHPADGVYPSVYHQTAAAGERAHDVPVAVLVGPCGGLPDIEGLSDVLELAPNLEILFRAFHGGFYRLDGRGQDVGELGAWISALDGVESVTLDRATIHVVPAKARS